MSFPSFTAGGKLADSSQTKTIARTYNALVANIQAIFTNLLARGQLDSVILGGIDLALGPNTIQHTLGRTLTGWSIVRLDAAASIYDMQASNPDPGTYLVLYASAPATISLEVF